MLTLLCVRNSCLAEDAYQLQPGEFPPANTARYIAGELVASDSINRIGTLRPDRTDAQRRGDWDLPLKFVLLPFGSISYHGAPAELRHIPLGTHLHGWFYEGEPLVKAGDPQLDAYYRRVTPDAKYNRALRLEDDFSHDVAQRRTWQVEQVDRDLGLLTVASVGDQVPAAKPVIFQLPASAKIWKRRRWATFEDLTQGQQIAINLTRCTLKGPGHCAEIWLDAQACQQATALQREVHRQFIREHGLPGMIDEVNDHNRIVSVALFDGFDPALLDDFPSNADVAAAANSPAFVPGPGLIDPLEVTAAVAEENLRTWDQINDRKRGPLLEVINSSPQPGFSGVRVRFQPSVLLEGFRPQRIIRLWPAKWKVDDLPREERLYQ